MAGIDGRDRGNSEVIASSIPGKITVLVFIYIFKIARICFPSIRRDPPLLQRLLIAEGADYGHERSGKIPA